MRVCLVLLANKVATKLRTRRELKCYSSVRLQSLAS